MLLEVALRAKGKLTLPTYEELLSGPLPFVDIQAEVSAEGLPTVTLIWRAHPVDPLLVLFQLRAMVKLLAAEVAFTGAVIVLLCLQGGREDAVQAGH